MPEDFQDNNKEKSHDSPRPRSESTDMERRKFLKTTTQVVGAALVATAASSLNAIPVSALSSSVKNAKNKPHLLFPVISDVHTMADDDRTRDKFIETLNQLNQLFPEQDAFVTVGDLTDTGYEEEYDRFMEVYDKYIQPDAVSMFAIGNHDYWNDLPVKEAQNRYLKKTGMDSMYYRKVIKGYHFIILATEDGLTEGTFSKKQIKWLDEQLQIAYDDDPEKPIFVFHHQPIKDTIYGSEWGFNENRDLFYDTLSKYPRAISFSGHTHYPLDDPRIIYQKDFTAIGTSTGNDLWLEDGRIQGDHPANGDYLNQALIVQVSEHDVLIYRRDIHNNDWTGDPFHLRFPPEGTPYEPFEYTDDRDKVPPYFTENAMASVDKGKTTNASLTLMLTQAQDNLLVHDYRIIATNEKGDEKEYLAFSEFYRDPVPDPVAITVGDLEPDTTYEFDIYALDAFGNESKNSVSTMGKTSNEKPEVTLSENSLSDTKTKVDVEVKNIRPPQSDWVGVYEENVEPGEANPAIWWMYTPDDNEGAFKFTYDPADNVKPDRYKANQTYKMVYFYGSGYDDVASTTFDVGDAK